MGTSSVKTDEMIEKWLNERSMSQYGNKIDFVRDTALHFLELGRKQALKKARDLAISEWWTFGKEGNRFHYRQALEDLLEKNNLDELAEVEI